MRALFMGTPAAAVPALRALADSRHEIVGVTCQPDRPSSRGQRVTAPPVKEAALPLGCPILQPEKLDARFREDVAALAPDVFVVVAYGRLLGPRLLAVAPHGAVNLHFSLLPRWRGAAPVQRAIIAGDEIAGVTIIRLVAELDAGPILAREEVAIEPLEHAPSLESRLAAAGAPLLVDTLDALEAGLAKEQPQDASLVTIAPPLRKEEAWLDPREDASVLERRVRALDPWPGAKLLFPKGVLSVLEARATSLSHQDLGVDALLSKATPGTLLNPVGDDVALECGRDRLLLRRVRPEGRAAMTGRSLVNGRFALPGDVAALPS